jgi:hypothetical protein
LLRAGRPGFSSEKEALALLDLGSIFQRFAAAILLANYFCCAAIK